MADLPPSPDANGNTNVGPGRELTPGIPRWVKVFGIVALVLILLVVIILVTGVGGEHSPGRHIPSSGAGAQTPPIADRVQEP
jgi:hypothetical protein